VKGEFPMTRFDRPRITVDSRQASMSRTPISLRSLLIRDDT
jgi:hypothetical protein